MTDTATKPEPNGLWVLGQKLGMKLVYDGATKTFDGLDVELAMAQHRNWIKINIFARRSDSASSHPLFLRHPDHDTISFGLGATLNTFYQAKTLYRDRPLMNGASVVSGFAQKITGTTAPDQAETNETLSEDGDLAFLSQCFDEFAFEIQDFFGRENRIRAFDLMHNLELSPAKAIPRFHVAL